jgi:hypothetical protein
VSVSWHRTRLAASARAQGSFGFYDSAYQIALLPQQDVLPDVTVDHEMSHINLVMHSSLGLLERILVWLEWAAHWNGIPEAVTKVNALKQVILSATEMVHEAAAWFGTELQTEGHENLKAFTEYAADVKRIRRVFQQMPEKPFSELSKNMPLVMQIVDGLAIHALSPPLMAELWSRPELISPNTLRTGLGRKPNNPLARFRRICSRFEGVPFPQAHAWSRTMGVEWTEQPRTLPAGRAKMFTFRRARDIAASFRSDLYTLGTVPVLRALARQIGLLNSAPVRLREDMVPTTQFDDDAIVQAFARFEVTHGINLNLDRYSHVCVLSTSERYRHLIYHEPDHAALALSGSRYLTVHRSLAASAYEFARGSNNPSQVILVGPNKGRDADGYDVRPSWYVDFPTAKDFLTPYAYSHPIIVGSPGYDFSNGDYEGVTLLKDIPHVVVTIRDFFSLWLALGGTGLAGCRSIEWRSMPSPSGRKHFGFLLFKPADKPFPILVNPCLVTYYDRAVTAAELWPSGRGVRLIESRQNPYEWMGAMTDAVMTAAAVFEMGASEDAVMKAALSFQSRRSG